MNVCITTVMLFLVCCGTVKACGRPRHGPPPDRTKPSIECPSDKTKDADPIQINTKVWWDEDSVINSVKDNRDRGIKPIRTGPAPGQLFSEGVTDINYNAKDKSGNYASCDFKVEVKVRRCEKLGKVDDGWKICHPSDDMRDGTVCKFGCYTGHDLVGPDRVECLNSEQWTSKKPFCKKRTCPRLFPSSNQNGVVDIVCTNSNNFRSICSYKCKNGYNVQPGKPIVRVCKGDGTWLGSVPECVDTEPPVFENCKFLIVGYTDRSKTTGRVLWNVPTAKDNSGRARVSQIYGVQSGAELNVGEHTVRYAASDAAGNTATCEFKVIMKQIKCHRLYPLPYTHVVCPDGRIFGSTCFFSCDSGSTLYGSEHVLCEKSMTDVPFGMWTFEHQPSCENQNLCPDLRAPDNGALACDRWLNGRFCHMMCQKGFVVLDDPATNFDEVQTHRRLLVCGDSGNWLFPGNIPNCQEVEKINFLILPIRMSYLYYEGVCYESRQDIKQNFLKAFTKVTGMICQPPQCGVSKVKILCGTSRYKKHRRDVNTGLHFEVTMEISNNQTSTDTAKLRNSIRNSLHAGMESGDLNLDIDGNSTASSGIEVGYPEATCKEGNAYIKNTFECVKCNKGYYHDKQNDVCAPCPRGQYQDESQQIQCKHCPAGTTTKTKGAYSSSQCEEACPAGYNSTTGTYPCSACDIGWYNEHNGSTECTPCQGSKITLKAGAVSPSQCKEFDITYGELNETDKLAVASMNIDDTLLDKFSLTFFVRCKQCDSIVHIARPDGQTVVSVTNTHQLQIEFDGKQYETGIDLAGSMMWQQVTVVNTGLEIVIYLNTDEISREEISNHSTVPTDSLNCTIGGEGFVGSISQLNMWSNISTLLPMPTETCFDTIQGDLISWKEASELEGSFVLTESACDVDDNCKNSPCLNNGNCTDSVQSFYCTCPSGFTGDVCEINIDDCYENPCDNNATCIDGNDKFTCYCPDSFTGELCETYFVDGGWTEWEVKSGCSVTCGLGVQQLSRVCENPVPINGGKQCDGDRMKTIVCETNTICINDCLNDPIQIENGSLNCDWVDNDTRVCKPSCDEGFDFDSVKFIETSGIICGPETGYTWNINNPDNPLSQLPSCTQKFKALENKVNFTAMYNMSLTEMDSVVEYEIKEKVNSKVAGTGCLSTGNCTLVDIYVYLSEKADAKYIMFTTEINCYVTGEMDECYDLLAEVLTTLNSYIEQQELTIRHGGNAYDVIVNSSSLSGVSVCEPGHIPVWQYCVSCGKGTYATSGYCEQCPRGYFQDEEAQTTCKQCPDGWTTAGIMTRDKIYCNIVIPDGVVIRLFITIVTAVSIGIVGLVAFVANFLYKRLTLVKYKTFKGHTDERKSPTYECTSCRVDHTVSCNSNLPGLPAQNDIPPVLLKYNIWSYGLTSEVLQKSIQAKSGSTVNSKCMKNVEGPDDAQAGTTQDTSEGKDVPGSPESPSTDHKGLSNVENLNNKKGLTDTELLNGEKGLVEERDLKGETGLTEVEDLNIEKGLTGVENLNNGKGLTVAEAVNGEEGLTDVENSNGENVFKNVEELNEKTCLTNLKDLDGNKTLSDVEDLNAEKCGSVVEDLNKEKGLRVVGELDGERHLTDDATIHNAKACAAKQIIGPFENELATVDTTSFEDMVLTSIKDLNQLGTTGIAELSEVKSSIEARSDTPTSDRCSTGIEDVVEVKTENGKEIEEPMKVRAEIDADTTKGMVLIDGEDLGNTEACTTGELTGGIEKSIQARSDQLSTDEKGLTDVKFLEGGKKWTNAEDLNSEKGLTNDENRNDKKGLSSDEVLKNEKYLTNNEDLNEEKSLTNVEDLNADKESQNAKDINNEKAWTIVDDMNDEKRLTYIEDLNCGNGLTAVEYVTDGKGLAYVEALNHETVIEKIEDLNSERGLTNVKNLNEEEGQTNAENLTDGKGLTVVEDQNDERGFTDVEDVTNKKDLINKEDLNHEIDLTKVEGLYCTTVLADAEDLMNEKGLSNDECLSDEKDGFSK